MKTSDFDYDLPKSAIAQHPLPKRDDSRLLLLRRDDSSLNDHVFSDLPTLMSPGDLLVLNDTQVIPARLIGSKVTGGAAEVLLLEQLTQTRWNALVKPGRSIRAGAEIVFAGELGCQVLEKTDDRGGRIVEFDSAEACQEIIDTVGRMPLPPYVRRDATRQDTTSYQTIYACHEGAVAAPTAGLHFTEKLLWALEQMGIDNVSLTLHVGPGTFRPVEVDDVGDHTMHSERYVVTDGTAERINQTRREGGRIVAVGTTSVRTLEAVAEGGECVAKEGRTELFLTPGYEFKLVDGLITNFHLPRSTLLMLVAAFAGRESTLAAYQAALDRGYRFYSYGDAMIIL